MTDRAHETLSWDEFGSAARALAQAVGDDGFVPDLVVAVARGGLPVAAALGYALGVKHTLVVNVEYYTGVDERLERPVLRAPVPDPALIAGRAVLVVDDVADTGATLRLVLDTIGTGVADLRIAALYEKPGSVVAPDYVWRRTDRWIDFPWAAAPVVPTAPVVPPTADGTPDAGTST